MKNTLIATFAKSSIFLLIMFAIKIFFLWKKSKKYENQLDTFSTYKNSFDGKICHQLFYGVYYTNFLFYFLFIHPFIDCLQNKRKQIQKKWTDIQVVAQPRSKVNPLTDCSNLLKTNLLSIYLILSTMGFYLNWEDHGLGQCWLEMTACS